MIKKLLKLRSDELITGSFILLVAMVFYNILNYIFQISMANLLGPADYSILAAIMSILYIFAIPTEAITNAISKYVSEFSAKKKFGSIKDLIIRSIKKSIFVSLVILFTYLIISPFLSYILKISLPLVMIAGLFIFIVFFVAISRGVLQGRKNFTQLGLSLVSESGAKLAAGICLVLVGLRVYGGVLAFIIGGFVAFLFALVSLREILNSKKKKEKYKSWFTNNKEILIATVSIVLLYSIDVLFARIFFPAEDAGRFAFVSLIGKVIFFVSISIGKAMFPISSTSYSNGKKDFSLLKKSFLIVFGLSIASLILYLLIPETVIYIISLTSKEYVSAANILFILGAAYSLISLSYIIVLYKLSIGEIKNSYILLSFVAIQAILMIFMNSSLLQFSWAILISGACLFSYSIYLLKNNKFKRN